MKDVLQNLLEQIKLANGPTKFLAGLLVVVALAVAGIVSVRASNPHFVLLDVQPDEGQLAAVQAAIANRGIRFKTSLPPGPFSIWVEEGRQYEARNAIAVDSALVVDPRGIRTSTDGASAVWLGSMERVQQSLKRKWQETEKQLETYNWISKARVTTSTPNRSMLGRYEPETVAVVLQLRGLVQPSREQRDTVATIVRSAFGVPAENVTISDQHGNSLHNGSHDDSIDEVLDFEVRYDRVATERIQRMLNESYGAGLATVSVKHSWDHDRVESVDETIDPSKVLVSKLTSDTSTPTTDGVGGSTGTSANLVDPTTGAATPQATKSEPATTAESREEYALGKRTTHTLQNAPALKRVAVTLLLDESIQDQLASAEQWVKNAVGFDAERGDSFAGSTTRFSGVVRDESGNPLPPEPVEPPEAPNEIVSLLLERGVEIVAAIAFLLVLLKSLKRSKPSTTDAATVNANSSAAAEAEPEVDLELLAKKQIEELVQSDPARVGALLASWATETEVAQGATR